MAKQFAEALSGTRRSWSQLEAKRRAEGLTAPRPGPPRPSSCPDVLNNELTAP